MDMQAAEAASALQIDFCLVILERLMGVGLSSGLPLCRSLDWLVRAFEWGVGWR